MSQGSDATPILKLGGDDISLRFDDRQNPAKRGPLPSVQDSLDGTSCDRAGFLAGGAGGSLARPHLAGPSFEIVAPTSLAGLSLSVFANSIADRTNSRTFWFR